MFPIPGRPANGGSAQADGFVDVLALADLPPAGRRSVTLGFSPVLLCNVENRLYAIAGLCPHALQPLADGEITADTILCAKHGARFDLATGRPLNGVTAQPLRTYALRIRNGRIEIAVALSASPPVGGG